MAKHSTAKVAATAAGMSVCMPLHSSTLLTLEGGGGNGVQGEQFLQATPVLML